MSALPDPGVSVVVLTWNEAAHIEATLRALACQTSRSFEVLVIDAASPDGTARRVRDMAVAYPVPLRLDVAASRISVGSARNRGVQLARGPIVAFLSADALPAADWVERIGETMRHEDAVFGRQVHSPAAETSAACVRGLRYHFPEGPTDDPAVYASDVNAAFRTGLLRAFPFGTSAAASAVDDLLLARRLAAAGHAIAYDPQLVVRHSDAESVDAEMRKNWREGLGWGAHRDELGLHASALAWAALLAVTVAVAVVWPSAATLLAFGLAVYAPAFRRAWRRRRAMAPSRIVRGVLATPPFDLAFLVAYLKGLGGFRS